MNPFCHNSHSKYVVHEHPHYTTKEWWTLYSGETIVSVFGVTIVAEGNNFIVLFVLHKLAAVHWWPKDLKPSIMKGKDDHSKIPPKMNIIWIKKEGKKEDGAMDMDYNKMFCLL